MIFTTRGRRKSEDLDNLHACEFAMLPCDFDNNIIQQFINNAARCLCLLVVEAGEVDTDGFVVVLQDSGVAPSLATSGSVQLLV